MRDDARSRAIRMFPDYADTVLRLGDPVDSAVTGLSDNLVSELERWEQSYYDSLTDDFEWVTATAARAYTVEGVRLAHRVAAEAAFTRLAEAITAEEREAAELRRQGDGEWTAYAPLSDTVFDPNPNDGSSHANG